MIRHVFVGAGDGRRAILMIGGRTAKVAAGGYPVSEVAARHGAGVREATTDPKVAYADDGLFVDARLDLSWIFERSGVR